MDEKVSLRVTVYGAVQGVLFRSSTADKADDLGLQGYVRNLPDGASVEVIAEGPKDKLKLLLDYVEKGPPRARITDVDVLWGEYSGRYSEFCISY